MIRERITRRLSSACFRAVHGRNLVYNTCWEDPRLDREALRLGGEDRVVMITSAGCNALDYLLAGAGSIDAVDLNPRQNALLELKLAGIRGLEFGPFFELFGQGRSPRWETLYRECLRPQLSSPAAAYWDKFGGAFFSGRGRRNSFYFHGTSGWFAFAVNVYLSRLAKVRRDVDDLLHARTVAEQRDIYFGRGVEERIFRPLVRWLLRRDVTLALLGVPRSQRQQLDRDVPGGVVGFIISRIRSVFTELPLQDNYFWRVYLTGSYTAECCPEYLKPENFARLKGEALVDRVSLHSTSLLGYLEQRSSPVTRYILLDHMDWLYAHHREVLCAEWQAIIDRAAPGCRLIWRSAGQDHAFVDEIAVTVPGGRQPLGSLLQYDRELADQLHSRDRVHTYGSFWIADLRC